MQMLKPERSRGKAPVKLRLRQQIMKRTLILFVFTLIILLTASCGIIQAPAPQPQLSATDIVPRATALSALPPTWTQVPTLTPTPTPIPSPTPLPTQDPSNFLIGLVLDASEVHYPPQVADRTGWTLVKGKTANIQIPPGFEVLDFAGVFMELMFDVMQAFADGFVEFAEDLGEELGAAPQSTPENIDLGQLPEIDFVLAIEETSQSAIIMASVEVSPLTTTEDLLNEALSDSEVDFRVASREIYLDSPLPMERVILDVVDQELGSGKQIIYAILGDKSGWNLVFSTPEDLFDSYLPLFESVADSFIPLP